MAEVFKITLMASGLMQNQGKLLKTEIPPIGTTS
jgi:hypothetical protein